MKIKVCSLSHDSCQLAQRLRHQSRLKTHMAVTHIAFEFGLRHQRRHRIHYQPSMAYERTSASVIPSACSP